MLDLRVPAVEQLRGMPLAQTLRHQWPVYLAYVLSFLQVGVVWSNHHSMFHYIRRSDHLLKVLNLLFLLCVAVLPFTTALLSEYARVLLYFSLPGPAVVRWMTRRRAAAAARDRSLEGVASC